MVFRMEKGQAFPILSETKDPMQYFVYIMSNKTRSTFYIGMTHSLAKRVEEHRLKLAGSFTARYKCFDLIYYEVTESFDGARERERILKGWRRSRKDELVKEKNPLLLDLTHEID